MLAAAASHGSRRGRLWLSGVLAVLILLAATALALPMWSSQGEGGQRGAAFSAEDEGHLRLVELAERRDVATSTVLTGTYLLEDLADPASSLVVVTRLDRELSDGEVDALVAHVERGGALLVASADARAGAIGQRFGVDFDGHPVLSSVTGEAPAIETPGGEIRPSPVTALHVDPDARASGRVLLSTSRQTFLDLNRDDRIDGFDRDGPFVVGFAIEVASGGRAYFLGASALLENAMLKDAAARAFVEALLDEATDPGGALVVFEGAREQTLQPLATGVLVLEGATRHEVARPVLVAGLPLAAVLVAWRYRGPASLQHVYGGAVERSREIEKSRLKAGLRELIVERARERAGLTEVEFDRLDRADKRAFIEATIQSLMSRSTTEARAFASLHLFEGD